MRSTFARLTSLLAIVGLTTLGLAGAAQAETDPTSTAIGSWSTNGRVSAIVVTASRVYVGGTFTAVTDPSGHTYPISNLAAYDPSTSSFDTSFAPQPDGAVMAMAPSSDGSTLVIGGKFAHVGATKATRLAEVSTSTGALNTTWNVAANYTVNALAYLNGQVYVGGDYTKITDSAGAHTDQYLVRVDATSGLVDSSWLPQPDAQVKAIATSADGTQVFVGGEFVTIAGSTSRPYLADLTTATMSLNSTFYPRGYGWYTTQVVPVLGLAIDGTQLFVAAAGYNGACSSLSSSTAALNWSYGTNGDTQAVSVSNGTVWCGGHFDSDGAFGGQYRKKLAAVNESTHAILPYAPTIGSSLGVWAIAATPLGAYIGGDFTKINTIADEHFGFVEPSSQATAPLAATNLQASAASGAVTLAWDVPWSDGGSALTRYTIYRGLSGGTMFKLATSKLPTYVDSTVTVGKSYDYYVVSTNAIGVGPNSAIATVTP